MKSKIIISAIFPFFLLLTVLSLVAPAAMAGTYKPVIVPDVRGGEVNEAGEIFAHFTGGSLKKDDIVIFRLPSGFIWTTADLGSDATVASTAYQTTVQWNTATFTADYASYGTANYVLVPKKYSGFKRSF